MKTGKNTAKLALMNKIAMSTKLETNDASIGGYLKLRDGDQPKSGDNEMYARFSKAIYKKVHQSGEEELSNLFSNYEASKTNKSVEGLLDRDYETKQVLIKKYASSGMISQSDSLTEQLHKVLYGKS